jgi:ribonuclease-3
VIKEFSKLQATINYTFKNPDLLKQAMVHRSYINEHPEFILGHNERLEFLGDAVLGLNTGGRVWKILLQGSSADLGR